MFPLNPFRDSCSICLQDESYDDPLCPVGGIDGRICHSFHRACIQPWIAQSQVAHHVPTCPLCRSPFTHINGVEIPPLQAIHQAAAPIQLLHPIIEAARNGDMAAVQALLADGPISQGARGWAVREASTNGHLAIVQTLLADGAEISQENRGNAVWEASTNGHLAIVQTLLADGAEISQENRGWAVRNASKLGHLAFVQTLLANGAEISQEHRIWAVIDASANGHLVIVQALLADGAEISQELRGGAVRYTSKRGHTETVQALLANGPISQEDRISARYSALRAGNLRIALLLMGCNRHLIGAAAAATAGIALAAIYQVAYR